MNKNNCKLFYKYVSNCKKVVYLCNVETRMLLLKTKNIMSAKVYTTSEIASFDFTIDYASYLPAGHGHKEVFVSVKFDLENGLYGYKDFKVVTDNMQGIDEADELIGQEQYEALFELVEWKLSGRIAEWIYHLEK